MGVRDIRYVLEPPAGLESCSLAKASNFCDTIRKPLTRKEYGMKRRPQVLLPPETVRSIRDFVNDPKTVAILNSHEAEQAITESIERVRKLAEERRAARAIHPDLYRQPCTI
jgi:hypothetical protein